MKLPRTRDVLASVHWCDHTESTNQLLREMIDSAPGALPSGTLVATADQTAGRGRAGRSWQTPPDSSIACSLFVRSEVGSGARPSGVGEAGPGLGARLGAGWIPLLAGSAVTAALQSHFPPSSGMRVGVKWPNDVHVRSEADAENGQIGLKICGILCELVSPTEVIVGFGINLLTPDELLPTERATSLRAAGADIGDAVSLQEDDGQELADEVIAAVSREVCGLIALAHSKPNAARTRVLRHSLTLGTYVRVHLPGGDVIDGRARALAEDGSLIVDLPTGGELTVSAGDVEHLR